MKHVEADTKYARPKINASDLDVFMNSITDKALLEEDEDQKSGNK